QRQVARSDIVPRRADADLRLLPVVVGHADRAEHAAGGGALQPVGDHTGAWLEIWLGRTVVGQGTARRVSHDQPGWGAVWVRRRTRSRPRIHSASTPSRQVIFLPSSRLRAR